VRGLSREQHDAPCIQILRLAELGLDYFLGSRDERGKVSDDLRCCSPTSQGLMTRSASEHDRRVANCDISDDVAFLAGNPAPGR
jgi:hypothetical protein